MSDLVPIVYYGGATVLFFFWIYGIVSFALDVKNKFVPALKQYRHNRAKRKRRQQQEDERAEKEEQLY
ncbi:hypothetical protein RBH26_03805 [Natronolimnohabitans sp. A-GB9]|uniref:hypothetical protein n=1 Tax=Natronolimnohabitans sp. A-GB9 TaxID=3069757 RepID=UPI0027B49A39|nr:hypothetical protein [Natronolimnohabitans sp. A-GB9]MDQ2049601.1 hypothetical protein [Natronolimnohabitans sp. A-GB9]